MLPIRIAHLLAVRCEGNQLPCSLSHSISQGSVRETKAPDVYVIRDLLQRVDCKELWELVKQFL